MADVISRLRLDSGEFDSKIKRAGQELLAYGEHCKKMGLEMGYANKDAKEFAKALGDMKTVSQTARGKLSELTEAFTNLKAMYNQMTDAEKQNTFGKELAASLDKLKTRINEAKENLNSVNAELGNTKQAEDSNKSGIEALTSALGINIKSLVGWGAVLGAGKMALDVLKDAFFASETNVDDWGRTVRSAEGVYQSFLQSLNTGDFSGFLNNIGQVTQAAREAYNALDELGTRMTIINPERARLQARQQDLRATIRRNGADSEAGKAALAELKKIEPMLAKSFGTESKLNYNAFEKLVRERLAQGGINLNQKSFNQFMKTFSSDAAYQALQRNARGSLTQASVAGQAYNPNAVRTTRTVDTRNTEQKLLDLFTDEWRQANSGFLTAAFNAQGAAASNALGNARYMKTGGGGGGGRKGGSGSSVTYDAGSLAAQQAEVSRLTKLWQESGVAVRDQYLQPLVEAEQKLQQMKDDMSYQKDLAAGKFSGQGAEGFREDMLGAKSVTETKMNASGPMLLDEKAMKSVQKNIDKQIKDVGKIGDEWSGVASAIGAVGNAMAGIEDPAAKVFGIIAQAIATIALTFAKSLEGTFTPWDWIAAAAAGTVTMISTISAIHSATGYAEGGIIKGNSYSGDNLMAMGPNGSLIGLNAGEVVLNRSQVNNLASALTGNGDGGGMYSTPYVQGEMIFLGVNNYLKRSGRGEIVTSKRG